MRFGTGRIVCSFVPAFTSFAKRGLNILTKLAEPPGRANPAQASRSSVITVVFIIVGCSRRVAYPELSSPSSRRSSFDTSLTIACVSSSKVNSCIRTRTSLALARRVLIHVRISGPRWKSEPNGKKNLRPRTAVINSQICSPGHEANSVPVATYFVTSLRYSRARTSLILTIANSWPTSFPQARLTAWMSSQRQSISQCECRCQPSWL